MRRKDSNDMAKYVTRAQKLNTEPEHSGQENSRDYQEGRGHCLLCAHSEQETRKEKQKHSQESRISSQLRRYHRQVSSSLPESKVSGTIYYVPRWDERGVFGSESMTRLRWVSPFSIDQSSIAASAQSGSRMRPFERPLKKNRLLTS